ncbi:MAG: thioredoxin family protein [Desulfobaccales bacterium]
MVEVNAENFEPEVTKSDLPVVVDLWGPRCAPCLALVDDVVALGEEFAGRVKFCKLNVMENRRLAITLQVMGVPTFLFYKGGELQERLSGAAVNLDAIRARAEKLLGQ